MGGWALVDRPLLVDASALNVAAGVDLGGSSREITVYVRFNAGTTGGVVTIEEAYSSSETGTWASASTVAWAAADRVHVVHVTGVIRAIRTRVSTAITGGTVSTWIVAN